MISDLTEREQKSRSQEFLPLPYQASAALFARITPNQEGLITGIKLKKDFVVSPLSPAKNAKIVKHVKNDRFSPSQFPNSKNNLNDVFIAAAQSTITSWPGYSPTPLMSPKQLPWNVGCARSITDEAHRFDLKSFKALGAYAVANL